MKWFAQCAGFVLAGAVALSSGCDDGNEPPPHLVADQPAPKPHETASPRPTTQQLLEGPRKPLSLGELPLSVQAPDGWALRTLEGTSHVLLEGPTPSGEASIQLNVRPRTSAAKLELILNGAKKELARFPQSIKMVEVRPIKGAQVLEQQRIGEMPRTLPDDDPSVKASRPMNWTITVFVPREADHETYELNFIGLTADQYEIDKPLLRGIVESITVQAAEDDRPASTPAGANP